MKKQYIYSKVSSILLGVLFTLIAVISCDEKDFTIIPEEPGIPTITAIEPDLSDVGTSVSIIGTNFSPVIGNNRVSFNGVSALVTSATETILVVTVPEDATTGTVSLSVAKATAEGPVFNVVAAPVITDLSVTGSVVGETITITGENFSATSGENIVQFGGVDAQVTAASTTELTVTVPDAALSGDLTVTVFGQVSTVTFTVAPVITSFSPALGVPGDVVTIVGTNFSADPSNNTVTFNGAVAEVNSATTTQLQAIVPSSATDGPLTVEIEGLLATSTEDFTIDSTTLIVSINDENDDVEEAADGRMALTSGDLELGEFDTFNPDGEPDLGLQKVGLRFNNVTIPSGTAILSASIIFFADQTSGADPTEMTIFGENVGNAAPYTEDLNNLSDRALTTANAVWNIAEWTGTDTPVANRTTVDITEIINEIIARGDWAEGNSMNFIFEATGVSAGVTANNVGREAESFDTDNPQEGAQLVITYL